MMRPLWLTVSFLTFIGGCDIHIRDFGDDAADTDAVEGSDTEGEGATSTSGGLSSSGDPDPGASSTGVQVTVGSSGVYTSSSGTSDAYGSTSSSPGTSDTYGSTSSSPGTSSSTGIDTSTTTGDITLPELCELSRGVWVEDGCGHTECGILADCIQPMAGCHCGPFEMFSERDGCVFREACQDDNDESRLCVATDGIWDPRACGHYECGVPSDCDAIIPGCNCGPTATFVEGEGCVPDPACDDADLEQRLCAETGGVWTTESCGHFICGAPPSCFALIPGCDCGPDHSFSTNTGCYEDTRCLASTQGEGDICDPSDHLCGEGLDCCYPCGIEGCDFQCMPVGGEGCLPRP